MRLTAKGLLEIGGAHEGRTLEEARALVALVAQLTKGFVWQPRKALCLIDAFIGGYGVEYFVTRKGTYLYVNTGDAYSPTCLIPLFYDPRRKGVVITAYGDIVEREELT